MVHTLPFFLHCGSVSERPSADETLPQLDFAEVFVRLLLQFFVLGNWCQDHPIHASHADSINFPLIFDQNQ